MRLILLFASFCFINPTCKHNCICWHLHQEAKHPVIPVMLGDAELAQKFASQMLKEDIYVIGFSFPVVPQGQARIRTQMSAAHSREDVECAIKAFKKVGQQLGIIK